MFISWYSRAFVMLKEGTCSRKKRSWLPVKESLGCWGWRQTTVYGPIPISPFVLLVHPSCYLLLGSQPRAVLFWSQFSCGCRIFGTSEGQSHSSTPLIVWMFLQGCTRVSSTLATCFAFAEASVSSGWGWAAPSLVWHSVTHQCCRHSGEQGCVTA